MEKFVYSFNEGSRQMRSLLGVKGANLAEMTRIGLPVPFGFTITTQACRRYYEENCAIGEDVVEAIYEKITELENVTGKKFGSNEKPLLVSVRSGSVISMPGMMDTILNLGLNDKSVEGLALLSGNRRFAMDSYRRFIQTFGDVVLGVPKIEFEKIFDSIYDLETVIGEYKKIISEYTGNEFPQDPKEQLVEAVKAVFRSWKNERAMLYRKLNCISADLGTAVNVQSMVFGNMGKSSGTGIAFTRNPSTGEKKIWGEFLIDAQGEDVLAGVRPPRNITELEDIFPDAYKEFVKISELLEKHYKDVQDMEFTIENNRLYMLQTRTGRRTAGAAVKIAADMVEEGLIDKKTAVTRLAPRQIEQLLHPVFKDEELKNITALAKGMPASSGAACGRIFFSAEDVAKATAAGQAAILVRNETSTDDFAGLAVAEGILTAKGSMTSHIAALARGRGKCCVVGCRGIEVDEGSKQLLIGKETINEGEYISIDGSTGLVYKGKLETVEPEISGDFAALMGWSDELRELKVRANADSPEDAEKALILGAEGVGLCRTEYMFSQPERLSAMRRMILADTDEDVAEAINQLKPYQYGDFKKIFEIMGELPVTIRLLDPPLHEFLPIRCEEVKELADYMNTTNENLIAKIRQLKEQNPMLGSRGCRLAISNPQIAVMQTEAIIEAAIDVCREQEMEISPEIMIPLPSTRAEVSAVKRIIVETAERCIKNAGAKLTYTVGTMIETPRAALLAGELAEETDFFSFGTNDLTQLTYGFSRDDAGKLIDSYIESGILEKDPFETLDIKGVGRLVKTAAEQGKQVRSKLKLGICGEHGGDPETIQFCCEIGMNYVSCSPYRIPVARLAAAQAAIKNEK